MGSVIKTHQLYTKNALATEFEMEPRTVASRMKGVEPDGVAGSRNTAAWYLVNAIPYLFGLVEDDDDGSLAPDPDSYDPKSRRDWYEGTRTKQALEVAAGLLVPADDVRREMAEMVTAIVSEVENLPDILERDFGFEPAAIKKTQDAVDRIRRSAYERVTSGTD